MTSGYLDRQIRDRVTIARDLARLQGRDWQAIGTIADGLEVMFALTTVDAVSGRPVFIRVSNYAWPLTGYWPNELLGRDPKVLQSRETDKAEARRFMQTLAETGHAEAHLLNRRKNGASYGCHILAQRAPETGPGASPIYMAFLSESERAFNAAGIGIAATGTTPSPGRRTASPSP